MKKIILFCLFFSIALFSEAATSFIVTTKDSHHCAGGPSKCDGSAKVTVTASSCAPPYTYAYTNAFFNPIGSNIDSITNLCPGAYYVTVSYGCMPPSSSTQLFVIGDITDPLPIVDLPDDTTICEEENLLLDAGNPGATYLWSTGVSTQQITVTTSGTYSVEVTNTNGCKNSDTISILVRNCNVDIASEKSHRCIGGVSICDGAAKATMNTGCPPYNYTWSTGRQQLNTTNAIDSIVDLCPDSYSLVISDFCNLTPDTVFFTITDSIYALPIVDLLGNTSICEGEAKLLDAGNPGATYLWSIGTTGQQITINSPATYSVEVTDANGCKNSDTIIISLRNFPAEINSEKNYRCNGTSTCSGSGTITISNGHPPYNYSWSNGTQKMNIVNVTDSVTNLCAGPYWVAASDQCNLTADTLYFTITDSIYELPTVDLLSNISICEGETKLLDAGNPGADYLWSTGENTQQITVTISGAYSVEVTDANGCKNYDTITVFVHSLPSVYISQDTVLCEGDAVILDATTLGIINYLWKPDNQSTPAITVTAENVYIVIVTDSNNCVYSDTVGVLLQDCPIVIYIPKSFTPNEDGKNDVFKIETIAELSNFNLRIFNRWGKLLFTSANQTEGWDGIHDRVEYQGGIYIWQLEYKENTVTETVIFKTGTVALMR